MEVKPRCRAFSAFVGSCAAISYTYFTSYKHTNISQRHVLAKLESAKVATALKPSQNVYQCVLAVDYVKHRYHF